MNHISGNWLTDPVIQAICGVLEKQGHKALFVGGCVRNSLLGKPINDIDIATNARPETTMRLFHEAGMTVIPTGIEHGTVTVVSHGKPVEITTFRRDVSTDGRHATVAFADCIEQDARRRDFTMNALYATSEGEIVDPLGGLKDLRAGHVKFIDDADQRIKEDYLRILRFFRFHAWYGNQDNGLDPEGLTACRANLAGLETLSKERITSELLKLLAAHDPVPAILAMQECGVLQIILPESKPRDLKALIEFETDMGLSPNPIRRLTALGARDASKHLRLSKKQTNRMTILSREAGRKTPAQELGYRFSEELANDILLLRAAIGQTRPDPAAFELVHHGASAVFPVTAADLMPEYAGAALGRKLKTLEQDWINSGFRMTKKQLLA